MPTLVATRVFAIAMPVLFMIALIPFVQNDLSLAGIYIVIIAVSAIRYTHKDLAFLIFGLVIVTLCEYLFLKTGVETFERRTLFGIMPIWLPLLWAYVFVAIKRSVLVFERYLG